MSGPKRCNRAAKYAWLAAHPEMWAKSKREIHAAMVAAGLYSQKTNWFDARIEKILERAKIMAQPADLSAAIVYRVPVEVAPVGQNEDGLGGTW